MISPIELEINDLVLRYADCEVSEAFSRLYGEGRFDHLFSYFHEQLTTHFSSINERSSYNSHYWAENSRNLLSLIKELRKTLKTFERANISIIFAQGYREAIDQCSAWLSPSGGSTIPENFQQVSLIEYERIFTEPATEIRLAKHDQPQALVMVGEGSYAHVFTFEDPDYGITFALKRAKKDLTPRDLARFVQEFAILKKLSFPYIVEVYKFDNARNQYTMEYCQETLRSFIHKRNSSGLSRSTRRRIALQFLYGVNYLHREGYLHRDISLQNILLKVFSGGAVLVKLSDFGLAKDPKAELTRSKSELRGTILDPLLETFRDYNVRNEIYAVGHVISYIFTGKQSLQLSNNDVGRIVQRCTDPDPARRYGTVAAIISDVEQIPVLARDTSP